MVLFGAASSRWPGVIVVIYRDKRGPRALECHPPRNPSSRQACVVMLLERAMRVDCLETGSYCFLRGGFCKGGFNLKLWVWRFIANYGAGWEHHAAAVAARISALLRSPSAKDRLVIVFILAEGRRSSEGPQLLLRLATVVRRMKNGT